MPIFKPASLELGSNLALAVILAAVLLLATFRLDKVDVPVDVREFTFGMCGAAGFMVIIDFLRKVLFFQGDERRRSVFTAPGVVAVAISVGVAYGVLFGSAGPESWSLVFAGAASMLVVGLVAGIWQYIEHRRQLNSVDNR